MGEKGEKGVGDGSTPAVVEEGRPSEVGQTPEPPVSRGPRAGPKQVRSTSAPRRDGRPPTDRAHTGLLVPSATSQEHEAPVGVPVSPGLAGLVLEARDGLGDLPSGHPRRLRGAPDRRPLSGVGAACEQAPGRRDTPSQSRGPASTPRTHPLTKGAYCGSLQGDRRPLRDSCTGRHFAVAPLGPWEYPFPDRTRPAEVTASVPSESVRSLPQNSHPLIKKRDPRGTSRGHKSRRLPSDTLCHRARDSTDPGWVYPGDRNP